LVNNSLDVVCNGVFYIVMFHVKASCGDDPILYTTDSVAVWGNKRNCSFQFDFKPIVSNIKCKGFGSKWIY
jgi:hypothetical protein